MSNFESAVEKVLKHEGGYVDHANDPGGATNYGISLRFVKQSTGIDLDVDGDGDIDADDIKAMTPEQAKEIYKTEIRNYISEAGMEGIDRYLKRMDVSYNNELNNLRKQFKVEILDPEDMLLTEEFIAELMGASIPGMDDGGVVMTQEKLNELFGKDRFLLSDWEKLDPSLQEVWFR